LEGPLQEDDEYHDEDVVMEDGEGEDLEGKMEL
jgi:hypothetical protein